MSTGYIDFVFEGSRFSPKKLSMLADLEVESLAEAGETGQRGRYKGKPMPYGLALLKVEPRNTETMDEALERIIDELSAKKSLLKESGVDEITLDVESLSDDNEISIGREIIKKISSLGASVEFSTLAENENWNLGGGKSLLLQVDKNLIKQASLSIRAINHPLRRRLIKMIANEGEISTVQLYARIKEEHSVLSQHLSILRRALFVSTRRSGKIIYYSVNRKRISDISQLARYFSPDKPAAKKQALLK